MAYYALIEAGFSIHFSNEDDTTLLQTLCLTGQVSVPKIKGIIQTKPNFTQEHYRKLEAKLMLNWKRYNNPTVKKVLAILKEVP